MAWRPTSCASRTTSRWLESYVLKGTTNDIPNWGVKVLAGNVNIFGALISADGWTTPELPPNGYLDLQVCLAPLPTAKV